MVKVEDLRGQQKNFLKHKKLREKNSGYKTSKKLGAKIKQRNLNL
jgi:hypothetical protein